MAVKRGVLTVLQLDFQSSRSIGHNHSRGVLRVLDPPRGRVLQLVHS